MAMACVEAMILGRGGWGSSEQKLHVFHVRTDHKTLALQELRVRSTSSRFSPVFDQVALRVKFSVK